MKGLVCQHQQALYAEANGRQKVVKKVVSDEKFIAHVQTEGEPTAAEYRSSQETVTP